MFRLDGFELCEDLGELKVKVGESCRDKERFLMTRSVYTYVMCAN